MMLGLVQSGQISDIVGPHASSETKPCLPEHWFSPFTNFPKLNLNFFFRSFLRNWWASLPYEMACKNKTNSVLNTGGWTVEQLHRQANFIINGDFPSRQIDERSQLPGELVLLTEVFLTNHSIYSQPDRLIDYSKEPAKSNNTRCIKKGKDNVYYNIAMQVTELTSETRDDATFSISSTLALKPNWFPKECSHDWEKNSTGHNRWRNIVREG